MEESWNKEKHPDWYRDIPRMRCLILGSFPPHQSKWAYPFFYPNRQNRFWKILAEIAGEPLVSTKENNEMAVEERYRIMMKLETGVQNLGLEIERKNKSALDTNIRIKKFQDISSIIDSHQELEKILLPGFAAPHSTVRSFIKYLEEKGIPTSNIDKIKAETVFSIDWKGRTIQCVILNSTSPASKIKFDFLLEQFKKHLL